MKWQNYITVDEWVELYKHIARLKELALLRAASGGGGAELGANVGTCETKSGANSPNEKLSDCD